MGSHSHEMRNLRAHNPLKRSAPADEIRTARADRRPGFREQVNYITGTLF